MSQPRWPSSLPPIFRGERDEKKRKEKTTTTKRCNGSKPIGWMRGAKVGVDTVTIRVANLSSLYVDRR